MYAEQETVSGEEEDQRLAPNWYGGDTARRSQDATAQPYARQSHEHG